MFYPKFTETNQRYMDLGGLPPRKTHGSRRMIKLLNGSAGDASQKIDALDKSLAMIEFDVKGTILAANANFCKAMGYEAREIIGKHHSLFVDPEYAASQAYRDFWMQLGQGQLDAREYLRLGKGGREVWIQASYNPVKNSAGKVTRILKVATDITAQKEVEAERTAKLNAVERVQATIEFTVDGVILNANKNFLATVGYALSEIQGKHHSMFVDPAEARSEAYAALWRRLNAGEFVAEEFRRIGKGGKEVWIQASYNPVFDSKGRVVKVVKFATDVTGRVDAINQIAQALACLAANDLSYRMAAQIDARFASVRDDFNDAVAALDETIGAVASATRNVATGANEISTASDNLSRRTEQQAASLEETAAALDEITATVSRSADGAKRASVAASDARVDAAKSGEIVGEAVSAMDGIESSSNQINQIISVIDEIAFQTNLLALNAGVEAARAGEAGRGFAVVAQEVRALAQRSADAAKEIKVLIANSSTQVERGVKLVGDTGRALQSIVSKVSEIDTLISEIAQSSREQATGLGEVNVAVNQMDQVTQQNAAMVEEATAAAASLRHEADELDKLIARFHVTARAARRPRLVA
ncbi:PAS domain S-box protein [Caulobacter vibrioides]|uniref:methyl-accepting chemotaxis protein n=1 Tax=Caulobacter vibrioides TaxID=155892 RepID=UPI000BB49B74|nr:PAS domain-containing methyl-accepting chemotaxis protein [Caulobacter vibrioides]ATC26223.1 PAS domain S-box protein [Caulobacter vibrioides]AZH14364.1 PAS domain S-box protein [Caulobacter vibrioides]PLR10921.1 PAS domain S-box protein [Caulobacter vibrioides]